VGVTVRLEWGGRMRRHLVALPAVTAIAACNSRVRGADQLELSGRDGITGELLGLRVGSLPEVRLASARPTRRRAASA